MNLQLVPHTHIDQVWPTVAPMLDRAVETGHGEVTIDQIRMRIVNKEVHLIVFLDAEIIKGATTVEFQSYPNKRIELGGVFGGSGVCTVEHFESIKQWCREMGASEFRTYAGEAQARLYKRIGMDKLYNVVGVAL